MNIQGNVIFGRVDTVDVNLPAFGKLIFFFVGLVLRSVVIPASIVGLGVIGIPVFIREGVLLIIKAALRRIIGGRRSCFGC